MIYYHHLDGIMFTIFGFSVHYYSIPYLLGFFLLPYFVNKHYLKDKKLTESFSNYLILCTILCARIAYVLFYNITYYFQNPLEIVKIWEGGMSFHGGLLGVILGSYLFAKKHNKSLFKITDNLAIPSAICLFFGRIMNFINGELYGKPTDQSWGVVFPADIYRLRHPSQLYEAFFEGFVLALILILLQKYTKLKEGILGVVFLFLYGVFRFFIEFFREPDRSVGYVLFEKISIGQILCLIMIISSVLLYIFVKRK